VTTTDTTAPAQDPGPSVANLDTIVSLSKRRGFIFPSSEIYGGINAVWDYGQLGVELKKQRQASVVAAMVQERDDIVGLDASIIMAPQVWVTSGPRRQFQPTRSSSAPRAAAATGSMSCPAPRTSRTPS